MEPMEGNSLMQLLNNRIFWVCVMAWFVAQAAKVVLTLAVERRLDFRRFFGLGGMPSSHSAVVTALVLCKRSISRTISVESTPQNTTPPFSDRPRIRFAIGYPSSCVYCFVAQKK